MKILRAPMTSITLGGKQKMAGSLEFGEKIQMPLPGIPNFNSNFTTAPEKF